MKTFFLPLLILLPFISMSQAAIVGINTGDSVFVGADSRLLKMVTNPKSHQEDTLQLTDCKIKSAGKYNFVMSDPDDTFRVSIIQKIAASAPDFKTLTDQYLATMKKLYAEQYAWWKEKDPPYYNRVKGQPTGTTWFFGFENNKGVLIVIHFYINDGVKKPVVASASTEEPRSDMIRTQRWPEHLPPGTVIPGGRPPSNTKIDQIKSLIGLQMKISPKQFGGPIDILVVTKNGRKWLQQKKDCN